MAICRPRSCRKAPRTELLRQYKAIPRVGAGFLNGSSLMYGDFGTGGFTASIGNKVMPTPAATICRRVSRLVARKPSFSLAPDSAHTSSA